MQRHPRHLRPDLGDFDPVVALHRRLRHRRHVGRTMLALHGHHLALAGRVGMQRPLRARMRLAFGAVRSLARSLVALAQWRARIVRRLRRKTEPGFQIGHPGAKRNVLGHQRLDLFRQRVRLRDQRQDQRVLGSVVERLQIRWRNTHPLIQIRPGRARGLPGTESIRTHRR